MMGKGLFELCPGEVMTMGTGARNGIIVRIGAGDGMLMGAGNSGFALMSILMVELMLMLMPMLILVLVVGFMFAIALTSVFMLVFVLAIFRVGATNAMTKVT